MSEESYDRLKEKYHKLIGRLKRVLKLLSKAIRTRDRYPSKESRYVGAR